MFLLQGAHALGCTFSPIEKNGAGVPILQVVTEYIVQFLSRRIVLSEVGKDYWDVQEAPYGATYQSLSENFRVAFCMGIGTSQLISCIYLFISIIVVFFIS